MDASLARSLSPLSPPLSQGALSFPDLQFASSQGDLSSLGLELSPAGLELSQRSQPSRFEFSPETAVVSDDERLRVLACLSPGQATPLSTHRDCQWELGPGTISSNPSTP